MNDFDPGPVQEPFATLAREYPGEDVYPPTLFRTEWGPIFHRGRLDGSARVLVIGQDPGQHESIARRILVGEAGQRVQGFLAKLGVESSYCMVNALLYSVYGQPSAGELEPLEERIAADRNRWFDALLVDSAVQAVVAFGGLARKAFEAWRESAAGSQSDVPFEALTHPTFPESSSKGDPEKRAAAMKTMLARWNEGLEALDTAIEERDVERPLELYGEELRPEDCAPIPERDMPAGSPPWMRSLETWARRVGETPEEKRATIEVVVPTAERPWRAQSPGR